MIIVEISPTFYWLPIVHNEEGTGTRMYQRALAYGAHYDAIVNEFGLGAEGLWELPGLDLGTINGWRQEDNQNPLPSGHIIPGGGTSAQVYGAYTVGREHLEGSPYYLQNRGSAATYALIVAQQYGIQLAIAAYSASQFGRRGRHREV